MITVIKLCCRRDKTHYLLIAKSSEVTKFAVTTKLQDGSFTDVACHEQRLCFYVKNLWSHNFSRIKKAEFLMIIGLYKLVILEYIDMLIHKKKF